MIDPEEVIRRIAPKAFQSFEVLGAFSEGVDSALGGIPTDKSATIVLVEGLVNEGDMMGAMNLYFAFKEGADAGSRWSDLS